MTTTILKYYWLLFKSQTKGLASREIIMDNENGFIQLNVKQYAIKNSTVQIQFQEMWQK